MGPVNIFKSDFIWKSITDGFIYLKSLMLFSLHEPASPATKTESVLSGVNWNPDRVRVYESSCLKIRLLCRV